MRLVVTEKHVSKFNGKKKKENVFVDLKGLGFVSCRFGPIRGRSVVGMDERVAFEIGVAVPKRNAQPQEEGKEKQKESWDCSEVLVREFEKVGLVVEPVIGVADEFIKVLAFDLPSFFVLLLSSFNERVIGSCLVIKDFAFYSFVINGCLVAKILCVCLI